MSFTKTITLPVTPDEAFTLLTEAERLRRWQTVTAVVDLRAGGTFEWTVTPGHVAGGTFQEVDPGRRIVFGWGWDGVELPYDASTVTITLEPTVGGTLVTLVHVGLDEDQAKSHALGWEHYFERLERLAATGDAGPDEWAWAPENLTPMVAAEAALAALQPVLRTLTAQDQPKPTPCAEFTCHELVEHLLVSLAQLGGMSGVTVDDPLQGSVENRVSVMAGQAISGWRAVEPDSTVPGPGGSTRPAAFMASILPVELLLHGWDIAQSSGKRLHVSDELVAYVAGLVEGLVPGGRGSSFAAEATAGESADSLDRLAAYSGRTALI